MNSAALLGVSLLVAVIIANGVVSVAVLRSHYYGARQKAVQVALVWLLPVVGSVLIGIFLYSQRDNPMYDTRAYPEPSEKAVPYTINESIQGHDHAP